VKLLQKLKISFVILVITILTFAPVGYLILRYQHSQKVQNDKALYIQLELAAEKYRADYLQAIKDQTTANIKKMEEAKANYESLLAQQPDLIKSHSSTQTVTTNTTVSTPVVVTKPVSSGTTGGSPRR
jgi:hypothetical protein